MVEDLIFRELKKSLAQSRTMNIGVALSGGLDSLVLAEGLHRLGISFIALHVNHAWRGEESAQDAVWIKNWCKSKKIPFYTKKLASRLPRTEVAGREARLSFYQKMASQKDLGEIWLGHHADDLAETFLLQLLRGAGPEGLGAMPERRLIGSLVLVRPLLSLCKSELKACAKGWKITWREDASNRSNDYLRNRVRRQLLPYLKKISGKDPRPSLIRCARILSDENKYWNDLLPRHWPEILLIKDLKKAAPALQRRMIRAWLISRKISNLSFENIETVRGLVLRNQPAKVNLSKGCYCRRREGVLFIEDPKPLKSPLKQ
jgi:tRNA(Ile)-lysidine synthase